MVFFDDFLVYILNLESHCQRLSITLKLLKKQTVYSKWSKCFFGQSKVEYLGHIISAIEVSVDPQKVSAT